MPREKDVCEIAPSAKKCKCNNIAKSGIQCSECKTRYHHGCMPRIKKCCGIDLIVNDEVEDAVNDPSVNVVLLRSLVAELRLSNSLLLEKIGFLEDKVAKKDEELSNAYIKINNMQSADKKTYAGTVLCKSSSLNNTTDLAPFPSIHEDYTSPAQKTTRKPRGDKPERPTQQAQQRINRDRLVSVASESQQTHRDVQPKESSDNDGFEQAKTRKRREKKNYGNADDVSFSAYIPNTNIHITKINLNVTNSQIIEHVKNKIENVSLTCTELEVKSGLYKAFKLTLPVIHKKIILNANFWPKGVVFKQFFEPNFRKQENIKTKT